MITVTQVRATGPGRLLLTFSDGTSGEADLSHDIETFPPFAPLKRARVFSQAHVEDGAVVWPDGLDIATERLYALVHHLPPPQDLAAADANELEVSLRELRKLSGVTQEGLAARLEVTQSAISQLETSSPSSDTKLSTLRRIVEKLGWTLEISAVRGDKRLRIRGV